MVGTTWVLESKNLIPFSYSKTNVFKKAKSYGYYILEKLWYLGIYN